MKFNLNIDLIKSLVAYVLLITIITQHVFAQNLKVNPANYMRQQVANTTFDNTDLGLIKQRLNQLYLNNTGNDKVSESIEELVKTLKSDGSWAVYHYSDKPETGLPSIGHLYRLVKMAAVYSIPGKGYKNSNLGSAIHKALGFWLKEKPESGNNWFNVIGIPTELTKVLILMDNELSQTERSEGILLLKKANVNGELMFGPEKATGQNMVWVSRIQLEAACLENSNTYAVFAISRLNPELKVTTGEGIQADWTFHQHGPQLYSGGYGQGFAADCSQLAYLLSGTQFALSETDINNLSAFILDGLQWMIRGNKIDYGTMGRELARVNRNAAGVATACEFMAMLNTPRKKEFENLSASIRKNMVNLQIDGNRSFWNSDFMSHQRNSYYTSVKMASDRTFGSESGNGEAEKNYHMGDGVTYIMKTGKEYANIFPLWDWQQLPGVTARISNTAFPSIEWGKGTLGKNSFVGSLSDGKYGLAAFDMNKDLVKAKKSWFYFDKEFVCLGSGISSDDQSPVITCINQCFQNGKISYADSKQEKDLDQNKVTTKLNWIYHDNVAYIFQKPTVVTLQNDYRTGDWKEINRFMSGSKQEQGAIFTLSVEHGNKPQSENYAYTVVPSIAQEDISVYIKKNNAQVICNTEKIQAVWHKKTDLLEVVFWQKDGLQLNSKESISSSESCLLMLRKHPDTVELSVSDPTHKLLNIVIKTSLKLSGEGAQWDAAKGVTSIVFNLPNGNLAGKTITKKLNTK